LLNFLAVTGKLFPFPRQSLAKAFRHVHVVLRSILRRSPSYCPTSVQPSAAPCKGVGNLRDN